MKRYVVVTRKDKVPIERFATIEGAADLIVKRVGFAHWTVLAQEANKITASTPYKKLLPGERRTLEQKLYPTLYE